MIKGLKVPLVMLVENVHVKPILLEVIVIHVNMPIMVFQIAKVMNLKLIALFSSFILIFMLLQPVNVMQRVLMKNNVMTMEGVLAKVPILLGINVINVLQVLKKFLIYHFVLLEGRGKNFVHCNIIVCRCSTFCRLLHDWIPRLSQGSQGKIPCH